MSRVPSGVTQQSSELLRGDVPVRKWPALGVKGARDATVSKGLQMIGCDKVNLCHWREILRLHPN